MNQAHLTVAITTAVFVLLYAVASVLYYDQGFCSLRVFLNFFKDNAFLGIVAVGMTFVILSGGIDLSVGSMIGFASIFAATLIEKQHLHPAVVIPIVLIVGAAFGCVMGCIIHFFGLAPFLVTLAGMFLARGVGYLISVESIPLYHPFIHTPPHPAGGPNSRSCDKDANHRFDWGLPSSGFSNIEASSAARTR
ncbi:MAG TPA: hypothetical protein VHP11_05880 [Tepidisphaeraceae bacterium]|nr:hypothetical protein [Tepidisphaeraceae bacterium]